MTISSLGTLYVVATPIGNLQDFTPRAQETLRQVAIIAAEDTRHTQGLLNHFGISCALYALHEHNEREASAYLLQRLQAGESVALLSDAGTPLVSDPGQLFIAAAHAAHIPVCPIPGASALVSALSVAGLSAGRFVFEGFLPPKSHARQQRLQQLQPDERTLVFYEAPHRLLESVIDLRDQLGGGRIAVIAKELTKVFETVYRATLQELVLWLEADAQRQKGEFVIVVAGAEKMDKQVLNPEAQRIFTLLRPHLPLKEAAKVTSEITGISKNLLYDYGLQVAAD